MYRYRNEMLKKEAIYIAGPECFYTDGTAILAAMRKRAEALGFLVTLPNDHPLDMTNPDKQKRADSIFADLQKIMLDTTVIVSDLEAYRGAEPDSGTIYEIGMAIAKGAKSYGYTRDKRILAAKNQGGVFKDGVLYDERGNQMPYGGLPFAPSIIGSTKIVEGDFDDCLKMLMTDIEEEYKQKGMHKMAEKPLSDPPPAVHPRPLVYLAGFERYEADGKARFEKMKQLCQDFGYDAVSPLDWQQGLAPLTAEDSYAGAAMAFDSWQQHVRSCDIIIANLNDYRGYEVNNDVAFECGMGFQLGKKLYGYMDNTDKMTQRIPNLGEAGGFRDQSGSNVEDFDYPVNLMFACSMKIFEGSFETVIRQIAEDLKADPIHLNVMT